MTFRLHRCPQDIHSESHVTHPRLHIRNVADAHRLLEAVRARALPLVRRRLLPHERAGLSSGNVFVWEESGEEGDDGGLVRWTDGRRWSQSKMRGDFLFYEEKIATTQAERTAKAVRRANKASYSPVDLPGPPKRKDRPTQTNGLIKQTFSVVVHVPHSFQVRKWHIVAYLSAESIAELPIVDDYEHLRHFHPPDGIFTTARNLTGLLTPATWNESPPSKSSQSDDAESRESSRSPFTPYAAIQSTAEPHGPQFSALARVTLGSLEVSDPSLVLPLPVFMREDLALLGDSARYAPITASIKLRSSFRSAVIMREILYIQAGTPANYVGTHFWNTQESYLAGDEAAAQNIDHEVSFREGFNWKGESILCPRLLAFDYKARFGTLNQANALGEIAEEAEDIDSSLWTGAPIEYKQERATKSQYQDDLDKEDLDEGVAQDAANAQLKDVRYWPDFNRLYYAPRTLQQIPDLAEWESKEGDWAFGGDLFTRYDEDNDLMDGAVRLFVEECETIQGMHIMHDTASFGSFVNSLMLSLRDEFTKLPMITLPLLSDAVPQISLEDKSAVRKAVNDAFVLRSLSELSSMTVALQSPTTWSDAVCRNECIQAGQAHIYHTSAILSTNVETATLPLRLRRQNEPLHSFCGQLAYHSGVPFAELGGVFLGDNHPDRLRQIYNFSSPSGSFVDGGLRRDVTRGFSRSAMSSYTEFLDRTGNAGIVSSLHAPAYPLPSSFPAFFTSDAPETSAGLGSGGVLRLSRPRSTAVLSTVGTSRETAQLFAGCAKFLDDKLRRRFPVDSLGIDVDEMKELANDLWTLHDTAGGDSGGDVDVDSIGEDE
ncbi:unnamed protein product [Mycena citricolor]|uniref:cAMP-independent regulatory protein pac2 n=1 Tax=Mycena citricolor TaxID=2018698 RepID=A0AAD2H8S5_9AGAR|nr:unnamed protein product [Mycena citricolor]